MKSAEHEIWDKLLTSGRPSGEKLVARPANFTADQSLLAAIDSEGRHHFLVRVNSTEAEIDDSRSKGLTVETRLLTLEGKESKYIDIVCQEPAANDGLDLLGKDLAKRLEAKRPPAEAVQDVLAKWRRFWGNLPKHVLTKEEQIGLFAEIFFLNYWLIPRFGPIASLEAWRGPSGARHDFEFKDRAIEVKGTISAQGAHKINGVDQMLPPEFGGLFLFSLVLQEEASGQYSLPGVVRECQKILASYESALGKFEEALVQAGYFDFPESEYALLAMRLVSQGLYKVEGRFPRIVRSSFQNGLPAGVEQVEYSVNLNGFEDLRISERPEQFN